ncbi:hypothetical protein [Methylogaea oryzae]|uniref:hypothetical protein n=1 Tax=Methylogaea oryzae TaxID=1295382 RepID=UPI00138EEB3A|nr:hypothetical protein [Methylogaea oryzae]
MIRRYLPLLLGLLAVFPTHARPLSPDQVPEPLRTWIPWVLQGHEQSRCPFLFDDHATALCAWPGPLDLRLDAHGGAFRLNWQVYAAARCRCPGKAGIGRCRCRWTANRPRCWNGTACPWWSWRPAAM